MLFLLVVLHDMSMGLKAILTGPSSSSFAACRPPVMQERVTSLVCLCSGECGEVKVLRLRRQV